MIVVDTNIVAQLFVESERTAVVRDVLRADPEWVAPFLWRSEFRNLLATYLRHNYMELEDALGFAEDAEALLAGREHVSDSTTVLTLAKQSRHTAYDCEFVSLADRLSVPFITADRKLARSFPDRALTPEEFLARTA
jgi:predicted nucleic acid-binding protein